MTATKDQLTRDLEFGVGSFTFETFPASEDNDHDWEDNVRSLLESIPTVRDVEIKDIETFVVPEGRYGGEEWEPDGVLLTPHPSSGTLSFRITIPGRIQRELVELTGGGPAFSNTESFYIVTFYRDFPVSYVFAEGEPNPYPIGSQAVAIVRKFLEQETSRYRKSDSIRFTFIGPSPLHCDFILRASIEEMKAPYMLERLPRETFDEFIITYDSSIYDSVYAAINGICRRLAGELGYFYRSVSTRNRRARTMLELRRQENQLMSMTLSGGAGINVSRFLKSRRLIRDLSLNLIAADYEFNREGRESQSTLKQLEQVTSGLFRNEIQREINDSFQAELDNMNSIMQLVASRQKRGVDITMLLITSLLGGIIGSILTVVFTVLH